MQTFVVILVSLLSCNLLAFAGFNPEWNRFHDSSPLNSPVGIATDSQRNACVLVDSVGAVALVKYSPAGAALWTNRFDSTLKDAPGGLAIAPDDSICVALVSALETSPGHLVVLKFKPTGELVWTRSGEVTNVPLSNRPDVAVDSSGNVFVAGIAADGYLLIKYDGSGTPQWTNTYPVPVGLFGTTKFFGVDAAGNAVLVAGLISFNNDQMLVLRCSPAGVMESSIREWPLPNDFLSAATMDSAGNLYVAANINQPGERSYNLYTAKYDSSGSLVWSRTRPPAFGFHHAVSDRIALDSMGNVIVTAYETYPDGEDDDVYQALTIKMSSSGAELWSARARGFDRRPTGLAIAPDDSIHVVAGDSFGQSALLLKYRPNGSQAAELAAPGHSPGQIAIGMTGEFYVNFSSRCETRKFVHADSLPPLSVTISPDQAEIPPGSSVTLTAMVSGDGPFTYDWRYQGFRTGVTSDSFTITDAQYQRGTVGDFSVIVSNATGHAISPQARVTVVRPPDVQLTPINTYAAVGQAAVLSTVVTGSEPIAYYWYFNDRLLEGAVGNRLAFQEVQVADAGRYSVTVSNRAGVSTSSAATLHVVLPSKSFTGAAPITIRTNATATPYPSGIVVAGVSNRVVKVTATLHGLNHTSPGDLGVLLQSPSGRNLVLMSGDAEDADAVSVTLAFDDDAQEYISDEVLVSGIFKPTFHVGPAFPAPAPSTQRVDRFADLTTPEVNGVWFLFVNDQRLSSLFETPGQIASGWSLTFTEAANESSIEPAFTHIRREGDQLQIEWNVSSGWRLQRSGSLLRPTWTDVPGSSGVSQIQLPAASSNQYFRLAR